MSGVKTVPTWGEVVDHCKERISSLQSLLESDISHEDTLKTRAKMRELRAVLALALGTETLVEEDQTPYLPE